MRKILILICTTMLAMTPLIANAATTSVNGTGSYEKLTINNGAKNLVFKVFAPGGKCNIKYLQVKFRDRDGTAYQIDGGCYPGNVWIASLVRNDKIIDCSGYSLKFNAKGKVWTATIPRTCLKKLGSAVKETYSYVDDFSPMPGEVPPSKYVKQG